MNIDKTELNEKWLNKKVSCHKNILIHFMLVLLLTGCAGVSNSFASPSKNEGITEKSDSFHPSEESPQTWKSDNKKGVLNDRPVLPANVNTAVGDTESKNILSTDNQHKNSVDTDSSGSFQVIKFSWCPKAKVASSYESENKDDMHRIIIPSGIVDGSRLPLVIGFHGQPKRGKNPRDYLFIQMVQKLVTGMIDKREIKPVILVLPAFKFKGGNWPRFNPVKFRQKIVKVIAEQSKIKNINITKWGAFGHSGAAGCGGGGLNQIAAITPGFVGFFDTCLGEGWQNAIKALHKKRVPVINIYSVETAGFRPRQFPEYQAAFDFGRAFAPLDINPVKCPDIIPGDKLRKLKHRCSATEDGIIKAFVIDTGVGVKAHKAIITPAVKYFLKQFI